MGLPCSFLPCFIHVLSSGMGPATDVAVLQFSVVTSYRFVFILLFTSCCVTQVRLFIRVLLSFKVATTCRVTSSSVHPSVLFIRPFCPLSSDHRVPCHRFVCSSVRSASSRVTTACLVTGASVHPCVLFSPSTTCFIAGLSVHSVLAAIVCGVIGVSVRFKRPPLAEASVCLII